MKRNSLLKGLTLSVALSAFLTGCGGGSVTAGDDNTNNNDNTVATTTISGNAVDGYLQYATVCLDLSQDGYCQANEPNTQTDETGKFTLQITPEISSDAGFESAMLLVYGGKDVDTGLDFNGKLLAPKDGNIVYVTPITTLVAKSVQKELKANKTLTKEQIREKIAESRKKVALALGLDDEDLKKDPVAAQKSGNEEIIKKSLQLQKAVEALLVADDDKGRSKDERAEEIYEALLDGLDNMQSGDQGVEMLLERTFEKAQNDTRTKELLGGDRGIEFADAAKSVARNIQEGFDGFDKEDRSKDDFLEKIASITKDDLKQVEIAYEEGTLDEISGQIKIDDGIFKPEFDWAEKYILDDLDYAGLPKQPQEVINKLKDLFKAEDVKPGVLFEELDRLKASDDPDIQKIYTYLKKFMAEQKAEKEKEEAKRDGEVFNIAPPMSFYMSEGMGYGKITFNENNTMTYTEYNIQQDGSFAINDNTNQNNDLIYKDGKWVLEKNGIVDFKITEDGAIILPEWNEKAYIVKAEQIEGDTRELPEFGLETTMPKDARMYFIKIEKTDDFYGLNEQVRNYNPDGKDTFATIPDFIAGQCGMHWFIGDENGGLAFAGTQTENGYSCDSSAKEGKVVNAYFDRDGKQQIGKVAGEWKIKTLPGDIDVLIVKPYNVKKFLDNEGDLEYPIFSEKDGSVYRGYMEPKGLKKVIPAFNESAMEGIKTAITNNWEKIQQNFPLYDEGESTDIYNEYMD